MKPLRSVALAAHSLTLLALLVALPGCAPPGQEARPPGEEAGAEPVDPIAAITEWQRNRDASARDSAMSPFTAVDSHYVEEGVTAKIGADETATRRDPEAPMTAMAAVTYREEAFWVERLPGSDPPFIHQVDEDGEPLPSGAEVEEPHQVTDEEVVAVGRYFLSMSPQSGFGRIIVYDPDAPMRDEFHGFRWFPPDLGLQVMAAWKANPEPDEMTVGTSRGLEKTFHRAGTLEFEVEGQSLALTALSATATPEPGERFFVPFRDATTGKETYEVGRYLGVEFKGEGQEHMIDFNRATNPLCNYSPHYNCPIPPQENTLPVAIRAGEMVYRDH